MADLADLLMLSGTLHRCPDCSADRVFVPIEAEGGAFCCTACGAALLIDPLLDAEELAELVEHAS